MSQVLALLIMGGRPEPWLPAVLESLADGVDAVVVNDNSGDRTCENRQALEASRLFREGRADVVEAPFVNFSDARNRCLARIAERQPGDDTWILKVDADEVHDGRLAAVTKRILPSMHKDVGVVDGYFLQFMQSLRYYIALDRRHDLFFRFTPDLRWERDVHEQLHGLRGRRVCLPYVFFHYGYASDNRHIVAKWKQYRSLGDPTYVDQELEATADMFDHDVPRCIPLKRAHPRALEALSQPPEMPERFHARVAQRLQQPLPWLGTVARRANYRVRLLWRAVQTGAALTPSTWPALLDMGLG